MDEPLFNNNYKNLWHSCNYTANLDSESLKNNDVLGADNLFFDNRSSHRKNKLPIYCHKFHLETTSDLEISMSPLIINFLDNVFELFVSKVFFVVLFSFKNSQLILMI